MAMNIRSTTYSNPLMTVYWFGTQSVARNSPIKYYPVSAVALSTRRQYATSPPIPKPVEQRGRPRTVPQAQDWFQRRNAPLSRMSASGKALPDRQKQQKGLDEIRKAERAKEVERQQHRSWKVGEVYAPHDLSPEEMRKWRRRKSPTMDAFDALGINPLDQYKNFTIMSEYMSDMGRIKPRNVTGLRPVNQRKIAKAIRRAIGIGLMPSVHRHPEVIIAEHKRRAERAGQMGAGAASAAIKSLGYGQ